MSSKSKNKSSPKTSSGKTKSSEKKKRKVYGPEASIDNSKSKELDVGSAMKDTIREEDIRKIASIQNRSLRNFSKTNELLGKFNDFSLSKYDVLQHMFVQHTRLLVELKTDLTDVFLRIRRLKAKLQRHYPEAFDATFNLRQALEDQLEKEEPTEPTYNAKNDNIKPAEKPEISMDDNSSNSETAGENTKGMVPNGTINSCGDIKALPDKTGVCVETLSGINEAGIEHGFKNNRNMVENEKLDYAGPYEKLEEGNLDESCKTGSDIVLAGTLASLAEVRDTRSDIEGTSGDIVQTVTVVEDSMGNNGGMTGIQGTCDSIKDQLGDTKYHVREGGDNMETIEETLGSEDEVGTQGIQEDDGYQPENFKSSEGEAEDILSVTADDSTEDSGDQLWEIIGDVEVVRDNKQVTEDILNETKDNFEGVIGDIKDSVDDQEG